MRIAGLHDLAEEVIDDGIDAVRDGRDQQVAVADDDATVRLAPDTA